MPNRASRRRDFLAQLGAASLGAVSLAGSAAVHELFAEARPSPRGQSKWDTSWVDKLASAKYRVAFDASSRPDDNTGADYAWGFLDQFHEVYGTSDDEMRAVIVYRQLGTTIGLSDAIWERYSVGADDKSTPPKVAPKRNPYWRPRSGASQIATDTSLERLTARGVIVLVCNIAAGNVAASLARANNRDPEEVRADVRSNLIPGALLVPSGVFALIRAQNAGCAFLRA